MGLALYRIFQQAGLPAANLQMEIPPGDGLMLRALDSRSFLYLCCRKFSNAIFLSRIWAIRALSWKGFHPRWQHRKILFRAWHSPGAWSHRPAGLSF